LKSAVSEYFIKFVKKLKFSKMNYFVLEHINI